MRSNSLLPQWFGLADYNWGFYLKIAHLKSETGLKQSLENQRRSCPNLLKTPLIFFYIANCNNRSKALRSFEEHCLSWGVLVGGVFKSVLLAISTRCHFLVSSKALPSSSSAPKNYFFFFKYLRKWIKGRHRHLCTVQMIVSLDLKGYSCEDRMQTENEVNISK